MTWANDTRVQRDLVFHAFVESPTAGSDRWVPLVGGSYGAIEEAARLYAHKHRARVLIIALRIDDDTPTGVSERVLLRMGQPWY